MWRLARRAEHEEEGEQLVQAKQVAPGKRTLTQSMRRSPARMSAAEAKRTLHGLMDVLHARLVLLASQYAQLQLAYVETRAGQWSLNANASPRLHEALAYAFMVRNPGARITSMNADAVGIDARGIPSWRRKELGDDCTRGESIAKLPAYAPLFPTGPGTVWFGRKAVEAWPDIFRDFLLRSGGCHESELTTLFDPWYAQTAAELKAWDQGFTSIKDREAPLVMQLVADLCPQMAIAKLASIIWNGETLYSLPGKPATKLEVVEAILGVVALGEAAFGDALTTLAESTRAAKAVEIARMVVNPLGQGTAAIVESFFSDEVVTKILNAVGELLLGNIFWQDAAAAANLLAPAHRAK